MASLKLHLSDQEYEWLISAADELGVTRSYIMRLALRAMAGLYLGDEAEREFYHVTRICRVGPGLFLTPTR